MLTLMDVTFIIALLMLIPILNYFQENKRYIMFLNQ